MPKCPRGVSWRRSPVGGLLPWILVLQGLLSSQCSGATTILLPQPTTEAQINNTYSWSTNSPNSTETNENNSTLRDVSISSAIPSIISSASTRSVPLNDDIPTATASETTVPVTIANTQSIPPTEESIMRKTPTIEDLTATNVQTTTPAVNNRLETISLISPTATVPTTLNMPSNPLKEAASESISDDLEPISTESVTITKETVTISTSASQSQIEDDPMTTDSPGLSTHSVSEKALESSYSNNVPHQKGINDTVATETTSNIVRNESETGNVLIRRSGELFEATAAHFASSSSPPNEGDLAKGITNIGTEGPVTFQPSSTLLQMEDIMLGDPPISSNPGRQERSFVKATKYPEQRTQVEATPIAEAVQTVLKGSLVPTEQTASLLNDQLSTIPSDVKQNEDFDEVSNGSETSAEATTVVETSSEIVIAVENVDEGATNSSDFPSDKMENKTRQWKQSSLTLVDISPTNATEFDGVKSENSSFPLIAMKNITGIGIKTTVSVSLNVSHMPNITGDDNSILFNPLDIRRYLERKNLNRINATKLDNASENNLEFSASNPISAKPTEKSQKTVDESNANSSENISNVPTTISNRISINSEEIPTSSVSGNVSNDTQTIAESQNVTTASPTSTEPTTTRNRFVFPKKPSRKSTPSTSTTTTTTTTRKPSVPIRTSPRRRPATITPPTTRRVTTRSTTRVTPALIPFSRPATTEAPVTNATAAIFLNATLFTFPPVTGTTTSTPFVPEPLIKIAGVMKIIHGIEWKPQLSDRNTPEFKKLAAEVVVMLEHLYQQTQLANRIKKIEIDGFSEGSVIVDYILYLKVEDDMPEPQNLSSVFNSRLSSRNTYGQFHLDPQSTEFEIVTIWRPKVTPTPVAEPPIPQWAIAVIVIGSASLIFIILFGAVTVYGRHHAYRKYGAKLQEEDAERAAAYKDWEAKVAAAYENLAADGVYDMDEVAENNRKNSVIINGKQPTKGRAYDSWRTDWSAHPGKKIRQSIDTSF